MLPFKERSKAEDDFDTGFAMASGVILRRWGNKYQLQVRRRGGKFSKQTFSHAESGVLRGLHSRGMRKEAKRLGKFLRGNFANRSDSVDYLLILWKQVEES